MNVCAECARPGPGHAHLDASLSGDAFEYDPDLGPTLNSLAAALSADPHMVRSNPGDPPPYFSNPGWDPPGNRYEQTILVAQPVGLLILVTLVHSL